MKLADIIQIKRDRQQGIILAPSTINKLIDYALAQASIQANKGEGMNSIESLSIALQEQTELAEALRQQAETLEAERDRLTATVDELRRRAGMRIFEDAEKAVPQQHAPVMPTSQGWVIRQAEDGDIIVSKPGFGGYAARYDDDNIASAILHALASDILFIPQQNAQAALSDTEIDNVIAAMGWELDPVERKDVGQFARAILAASQQPAAAPASSARSTDGAATFYFANDGEYCTHQVGDCQVPVWLKDHANAERFMLIIDSLLSRAALASQASKDTVDSVLLEMQPGGALYQPPSAMDEQRIIEVAKRLPQQPWGIGSRREDAIAFAWEVLKDASQASKGAEVTQEMIAAATQAGVPQEGGGFYYPFHAEEIGYAIKAALAAAPAQASKGTLEALQYARQVIDTLSEKAHSKADRIYCMNVLKSGNCIDAALSSAPSPAQAQPVADSIQPFKSMIEALISNPSELNKQVVLKAFDVLSKLAVKAQPVADWAEHPRTLAMYKHYMKLEDPVINQTRLGDWLFGEDIPLSSVMYEESAQPVADAAPRRFNWTRDGMEQAADGAYCYASVLASKPAEGE